MIINTVYMVLITLIIATPIGISTALFLTQYAKQGRLVRAIRFTTEVWRYPVDYFWSRRLSIVFRNPGFWLLDLFPGSLTMTMMILPTLVRTTEEAILSVPMSYQEGALALGAGRLRHF